MLKTNVNNRLVALLEKGDVSTVDHLMAMGFSAFDLVTQVEGTSGRTLSQSIWAWAAHSKSPEIIDRLGEALLRDVREEPQVWRETLLRAWTNDEWALWQGLGPGPSPMWNAIWHTATSAMAVAFSDNQAIEVSDPDFWRHDAGRRVMTALCLQMGQSRMYDEKDHFWQRLQDHRLPLHAWEQRLPLGEGLDPAEQTPLAWAARSASWSMVGILARAGVSADEPFHLPSIGHASPQHVTVTPLALCMQGLVLNEGGASYEEHVCKAIQALLDAGADLDQPTVILAPVEMPPGQEPPNNRYDNDDRGVFCGCDDWSGSPSVRDVLRAWVDHPNAHHATDKGLIDGIPMALVHGWRARLDGDAMRQALDEKGLSNVGPQSSRPRL